MFLFGYRVCVSFVLRAEDEARPKPPRCANVAQDARIPKAAHENDGGNIYADIVMGSPSAPMTMWALTFAPTLSWLPPDYPTGSQRLPRGPQSTKV